MIDIHSHTIFGVDDGAETKEQSIEMLKAAHHVGVTKICFTPHYMEDGYHTERDILLKKVDELRTAIEKENIPMNLYLGEEIFIYPQLGQSLQNVICLNDSQYVLVELPLFEEISYIDEVFYELLAQRKTPILAHPERYYATSKDFSFVEKLVEKGVLLQINLNSLIGHHGSEAKRLAVKLLKHNLVTFVGSDAHSAHGYYQLRESLEVLRKLVGEEQTEKLVTENPQKVLNNEWIEACEVKKQEKTRGFMNRFWGRVKE